MHGSTPTEHGPLDRSTAMNLLAQADTLLDSGDFQDAAALFQRVVGFDDPTVTAAALLGLGESLYRMDEESAALSTWQSILQLPETPSTYQAWRRIAAAHVRDGDLKAAIAAYREADRRAPPADKAEIASRLGWLAKETGDRRAAGRYFARSRGDSPPISASMAVLVATVVVSFVAMTSGGGAIFEALQLDKVAVAQGEYWRLVSVTLLHAGVLHLGFNMYALYLAGPIVERQYGAGWFLAFYVLCAVGGSVATFVLGPSRLGVGASGAIFGLFGILMAASRTHQPVLDREARRIVPQLGSIVLINLLLGFVIPNIDNLAHVGGLLTGLWLGFVVRPSRVQTLPGMWEQAGDRGTLERRIFPTIGLAVLAALLVAGIMVGTLARRGGGGRGDVGPVVAVDAVDGPASPHALERAVPLEVV